MNEAQLRSRTRRQLLALAGKYNLRGRYGMSKEQLVAAIKLKSETVRPPRRRKPLELRELTELPSSYGQTRLTLMGINPFWVHAYWEVTPNDREATMARLGHERGLAHWVLRFYDVTWIDFDGTNAHGWFDQPVDLIARNWYVNLWSSEKTYCADLGALAPSGRFEPACRSNFVHTPRADESPRYQPEWLRVEAVFDKIDIATTLPASQSPVSAGDGPPRAQTEPPISNQSALQMVPETVDKREPHPLRRSSGQASRRSQKTRPPQGERISSFENNDRTARPGSAWHEVRGDSTPTLGSFGSAGWAPTEHAAVELKLNAEMITSGRAQPGQAVQLNDQWLKVDTDGTSSVRRTLPLGK